MSSSVRFGAWQTETRLFNDSSYHVFIYAAVMLVIVREVPTVARNGPKPLDYA